MSCELVLAPSFPILLDRLLAEIRQACTTSPLSPKWVVVPSSAVANALRVTLAQEAEKQVLAGVHVIPLPAFVRRFSDGAGAMPAERWSPALDLLLLELVEQLPPSSRLAPLQDLPSGYRLIRPTFLDLGDGGFGPQQLEVLEEVAREPDLVALEKDTLNLYASWIRLLGDRQLGWEPLAYQRIPEWIETIDQSALFRCLSWEGATAPMVTTYGFYGFTDVNAQVLAALGKRIDLRIFYPAPSDEHPAFSFAAPILQDLKARMGTRLDRISSPPPPPQALPCLDFFLDTFPEGQVREQPQFLTFQRASGVRAELVSAALRIRRWLDDARDPIRAEHIMVVAPDPTPYASAAAEVFAEFAIPLALIDIPAGPTPETHTLQTLVRMWEDRGAAEWVLEYLREHPQVPIMDRIDLPLFEEKVRRWGVWGDLSWGVLLEQAGGRVAANRLQLPSFTEEELHLVSAILADWGADSPAHRPFTVSGAIEFLARIRQNWLPQADLLDPLYRALEGSRSFCPQLVIAPPQLREMVLQSASPQMTTQRMDSQAVRFLPMMRARGLASRGMVLLGLAGGIWPLRIEEDPLLSDLSRAHLAAKAKQLGHLLPIKSRAAEEMSMLFFLLNTATEGLHWVIPESDSTGRSVAPTPWVQHYLQRWEGGPGGNPDWPRIPPSPVEQGKLLKGLDQGEGTCLPPGFLVFSEPSLRARLPVDIPYAYLIGAQQQRENRLDWNGHVPAAALPVGSGPQQRVSVTGLENLARCPYRFYAKNLMEWLPLEPLGVPDQLNPLKWGSLVHAFLEGLFQDVLGREYEVGAIAESMLELTDQDLQDHLRQLPPSHHVELEILPGVFRQATQERLFATARSYFREVMGWQSREGTTIQLELKRRVPFPGLEALLISGQMDRVDRHPNRLHIHDYKSGAAPRNDAQLEAETHLGYRMQPLLYPWILQAEHPRPEKTGFSFVFLGSDPPVEKTPRVKRGVEEVLEPLGKILQGGLFLPTPTTSLEMLQIVHAHSCQFCDYSSLCRRFDPEAHSRYSRLSRQHLSSRIDSLQGSGSTGEDTPE